MIYTEEDLRREFALHKCRAALQAIDVPGHIIEQFKPGRLLDYFVHLCIMEKPPMHWRQALAWINQHRDQIIKLEHDESRPITTSPSDGETNNRNDAVQK